MNRFACVTRVLRGLIAFAVGAFGCQAVAGIEERHLDDHVCIQYCDAVMASCTNDSSVYPNRDACLGACHRLDQSEPDGNAPSNTIACRTNQALAAAREPNADCPLAGPGGGDECGPDCASYCRILARTCSKQLPGTEAECVRECAALRRSNTAVVNGVARGDTLDCRLWYLGAATVNPRENCVKAAIAPANPAQPCTDPAQDAPRCDDYCRIVTSACTDDFKVYDSFEQCKTVCAKLPPGTNADSAGNTKDPTLVNSVGCRKYHAYSALSDPSVHCPHAGPTDDGYCGGNTVAICESYCMIAKAACSDSFKARFSDDAACQVECAGLDGATEDDAENEQLEYSVKVAEHHLGPTVACRTLHAIRAFDNSAECPAAFGGAPCGG